MAKEDYWHLGTDDCDIPHLQEREVAQKEIHGLVQLSITADGKDDKKVL
jgi:hypothetical protein